VNNPLDPKSLENALIEGRARIMWGDAPAKVSGWLREQGLSNAQINQLLQEAGLERAREVRGAGIDDLFMGFLFVLLFGGIFTFMFFSRLRFALIDFSGLAGSAYGVFLMLRGVYRLIEGGSYQGSISELSKDD